MVNLTKNVNNGTKENGMEQFINELFETLTERFDGEVKRSTVQKANTKELIGFTFIEKGNEIGANPTLYPEGYYEKYVAGVDIEDIADDMLAIVEKSSGKDLGFDVDVLTNWELVKDKVRPMVVSKENNAEYLSKMAYTDTKTDLAIIYSVVLSSNDSGMANVKITKQMLEKYEITMTELKKVAFKNIESQFEFKNMADTLRELMGEEQAELMGIEDAPLWVLSTEDKTNGAGVMFVPKVLKAVKERIGLEQFYILPSSIHEVLVVSDTSMKVDELRNMVREVNATQVAPAERLSDNVYFYDGKKLSVA